MEKLIQYCTKESLFDGPFDVPPGWPAPGMGDIIVTENGKLIVVDGGMPEDKDDFVALLEKEAGGKKPEVEMWIITHPHDDHCGCALGIAQDPALLSRVSVKKFVYYYPDDFIRNGETSMEIIHGNETMDIMLKAFGAESYRPSRDERIVVDGMEFHFLHVPDDCSIVNTRSYNANYCSLIFAVQGKNKKAIITGDAYDRSLHMVAWRYDRAIKCDILQMPHHGFCDAFCEEFYRYADPQIILIPISKAGDRSMRSEKWYRGRGGSINMTAIARAEKVYKAFEGTVEIPL